MENKIEILAECCKKLNIEKIDYNQQLIDLYILRDYLWDMYACYAHIEFIREVNQWRYRIIDQDSNKEVLSDYTYEYKGDALIDALLKIMSCLGYEDTGITPSDDSFVYVDQD